MKKNEHSSLALTYWLFSKAKGMQFSDTQCLVSASALFNDYQCNFLKIGLE